MQSALTVVPTIIEVDTELLWTSVVPSTPTIRATNGLSVAEKKASLIEITGRSESVEQKDFIDEFRRMTEDGAEYERRETIDGVSTLKYRYDKSGEEHFNLISALHKSLRNSDVHAGVYWLTRMLEGVWDIEIPTLTIEGPNYTYPSDINELRGATRGFIRSDEEGLLSSFYERSSRAPLSVILVDEVSQIRRQATDLGWTVVAVSLHHCELA